MLLSSIKSSLFSCLFFLLSFSRCTWSRRTSKSTRLIIHREPYGGMKDQRKMWRQKDLIMDRNLRETIMDWVGAVHATRCVTLLHPNSSDLTKSLSYVSNCCLLVVFVIKNNLLMLPGKNGKSLSLTEKEKSAFSLFSRSLFYFEVYIFIYSYSMILIDLQVTNTLKQSADYFTSVKFWIHKNSLRFEH